VTAALCAVAVVGALLMAVAVVGALLMALLWDLPRGCRSALFSHCGCRVSSFWSFVVSVSCSRLPSCLRYTLENVRKRESIFLTSVNIESTCVRSRECVRACVYACECVRKGLKLGDASIRV
jgi:hypothetical protein